MKKGTVTVAVYGTLKRGYSNHHLLHEALFLGNAETGSPFRLYCVGFPVLLPATEAEPGLPVAVELYEVTRKQLRRLDRLESNGRMYQRSRRRFKFSSGGVTHSKRAWVYIGKSFEERHMRKVEPTQGLNVWPDRERAQYMRVLPQHAGEEA